LTPDRLRLRVGIVERGDSGRVVGNSYPIWLGKVSSSLGNNTRIPAKDRSELRITFEHGVHSAMPPDTSIL
jgi:hypothetical protein